MIFANFTYAIEKPEIRLSKGNDGFFNYIYIISKDNGTQIDDVIVNRGNCKVKTYKRYKMRLNLLDMYDETKMVNPDQILDASYVKLEKLSEENKKYLSLYYDYIKIWHGIEEYKLVPYAPLYDNPDKLVPLLNPNEYSFEEINKFINTIDPKYRIAYEYDTNLGKVIDFGQKASYSIGCDVEDVLEVIIKIGDKEFKYESQKFEIGVIF